MVCCIIIINSCIVGELDDGNVSFKFDACVCSSLFLFWLFAFVFCSFVFFFTGGVFGFLPFWFGPAIIDERLSNFSTKFQRKRMLFWVITFSLSLCHFSILTITLWFWRSLCDFDDHFVILTNVLQLEPIRLRGCFQKVRKFVNKLRRSLFCFLHGMFDQWPAWKKEFIHWNHSRSSKMADKFLDCLDFLFELPTQTPILL